MRERACDTDSHQDGVGSEAEADAEPDGEAEPAPEDGEGGIAATAAERSLPLKMENSGLLFTQLAVQSKWLQF